MRREAGLRQDFAAVLVKAWRTSTGPARRVGEADGNAGSTVTVVLDGHPATSKLDLYEGMLQKILDTLDQNPKLKAETALFITFDEGGGYYDSGYIQPLDFFGDGPRIPLVVVSPFSRGGKVVHSYNDHASILKFIERNWSLAPLTARSRDNFPNPVTSDGNPYVPTNSPAIGDLFDMFHFGSGDGHS